MPGIADQYRTIEARAGWRRRAERGRLRFSGRDTLAFLQALLTNDVAGLGQREGAYSAYLTPQGRMITDLHLYAGDGEVIADVPAGLAASLAGSFDDLIFAEDASVADVSGSIEQLWVVGSAAAEVIGQALGIDAASLAALPLWSHRPAAGAFVARTDGAVLPSYDIFVPADRLPAMVEALTSAGVSAVSDELATAIRIDAGRPQFGIDMDTDTIPLEAGLLARAISTTKGCYVGQEVIVRVLHRGGGRVARRLVKIEFDTLVDVPPETTLHRADKEVGVVTSSAPSLDGTKTIALGYVRRESAEAGSEIVTTSPKARGVIADLVGTLE